MKWKMEKNIYLLHHRELHCVETLGERVQEDENKRKEKEQKQQREKETHSCCCCCWCSIYIF